MIHGHGGNIFALAHRLGCHPDEIVDMSSNINPLGTMPGLLDHLGKKLNHTARLPEADGRTMIEALAGLLEIDAHRILAGNGTTQFIYTAPAALAAHTALILGPTYADYADACRMHGIDPQYCLLDPATGFEPDLSQLHRSLEGMDLAFICNPNNPTGGWIDADRLRQLCRAHPRTCFIVDESYLSFATADHQSLADCGLENLVVLWSASKIFGMPGLRAGFLIAPRDVLARFAHYAQPWCVNSLAQAAVTYLGRQKESVKAFIEETVRFLEHERELFIQRLQPVDDLTVYPSVTSYLLLRLPESVPAGALCDALALERLLIRNCDNFHGLSSRFVRVALKSSEENRMAANLVTAALDRLGRK